MSGEMVIENRRFLGGDTRVTGGHHVSILGCECSGNVVGLAVLGDAVVNVRNSTFFDMSRIGVSCGLDQTGSVDIRGCDIAGDEVAIKAENRTHAGSITIMDSVLRGGTTAVAYLLSRQ